jgi:hypothetical protein
MKKCLLLAALMAIGGACASATVLYVSATGSDSNPCTIYYPCRTFAKAYTFTSSGDTILALGPGEYLLGTTVNAVHCVTIDGGSEGAYIAVGVDNIGIVFEIPPGDHTCIVRNLRIVVEAGSEGLTTTMSHGATRIEHVSISVEDPTAYSVIANLDGSSSVDFKDVSVIGGTGVVLNTTYGVTQPYQATFENFSAVNWGGAGVNATDGNLTFRNSSIRGAGTGLSVIASATSPIVTVDSCDFVNNSIWGIGMIGGGTLRLSNSVITGNGAGIHSSGNPTLISFRNNVFANNVTDGAPALSTSLK